MLLVFVPPGPGPGWFRHGSIRRSGLPPLDPMRSINLPTAVDALGVSACRPQMSSALISNPP
jgi:hypothetical protein